MLCRFWLLGVEASVMAPMLGAGSRYGHRPTAFS
jgi:hypothetical protein